MMIKIHRLITACGAGADIRTNERSEEFQNAQTLFMPLKGGKGEREFEFQAEIEAEGEMIRIYYEVLKND